MNELIALQSALAAEQAVVYGYGVLGAHLSGRARTYAAGRLTAHENLRDRIAALVAGQGATPVTAQPAYRLPFPVTDQTSAKALAAHLENGAAGAAWDLTAAAPPGSAGRSFAVDWIADVAVAAARWGSVPPLPGQPA